MIQKLQNSKIELCSSVQTEPILMCAADDNYVLPLAVTLHSAAQHLAADCHLKVILLDGGISEENWIGLKETLADLPIEIFTVRPDLKDLADLRISHHITHTAYLRLLAARLLPESIDRVIYLDSDVLVRDDISQLWDMPLEENFALAVPDIACPFVDMRFAESNFKKSSPYLSSLTPIRNWKALGLEPDRFYFNSGVMVLNIERMRSEQSDVRLLKCLRDNAQFVWCWDQYALNVVFADQWTPLPLRWNQGAHIYEFPDETHSPLNQRDFVEARDNPAIIHFTTEWKPWDFKNKHPQRKLFFEQLDQTAWNGWRPENPGLSLKESWQSLATEFVKTNAIGYRKAASLFSPAETRTAADKLPRICSSPATDGDRTVSPDKEADVPQLTIFTVPKPFIGETNIAQRNAIASWKQLESFVEVVVIGDEPGTAEAAAEFNIQHLPDVKRNDSGTPLLGSVFSSVRAHSNTPLLAFCNCDVILFDDFLSALVRLIDHPQFEKFVAIGRRVDMRVTDTVDFSSDADVRQLRGQARTRGKRASIVCKDFFVFPREMYAQIPDFAVGRGNWDNWMVRHAKQHRVPVVSISDCVLALHQIHDYAHHDGGRRHAYVSGHEARENQKLAAGRHLLSGSTSDFRLGRNRLSPSRMTFWYGEFWRDFPRFMRLLVDFVGSR